MRNGHFIANKGDFYCHILVIFSRSILNKIIDKQEVLMSHEKLPKIYFSSINSFYLVISHVVAR